MTDMFGGYTRLDVLRFAAMALDEHRGHLGLATGELRRAFPMLTLKEGLDIVQAVARHGAPPS